MITTFRIHPEIESYIRKQSEEENRLLEESLLAEGCRDPLVVWEEENVLVDGHHRIAICRKHGLSYSVVYRSFPDIEAVKRWMRLNQLSRRNLDKDERERWIKELHEEGWTQAEIGEAVGITQSGVARALRRSNMTSHNEPSINSTSATEELEAKQREIERLRAEKDALAERQRHEVEARARAEGDLLSVKNQLEFLRNKAKEEQPEPDRIERDKESLRNKLKEEQERHDAERKELIAALNAAQAKAKQAAVPEVVEKEVVREVVPLHVKEQLARLEGDLRTAKSREDQLQDSIRRMDSAYKDEAALTERKFQLEKQIRELREKAEQDRVQVGFEEAVHLIEQSRFVTDRLVEFGERGMVTVEMLTQVELAFKNLIAAANDGYAAIRKVQDTTKKGGMLRAL